VKVGGWAKVVGNVEYAGRVGKVARVCNESDKYDYCLRFPGDPNLYAFRLDDLVTSGPPQPKRPAPVKVQDANARKPPAPVKVQHPNACKPPAPVKVQGARKPPIGWYPDPAQLKGQRYWNGEEWTGYAPGQNLINPGSPVTTIAWGVLVVVVIIIAVILFAV
jgi:hypothetical protein